MAIGRARGEPVYFAAVMPTSSGRAACRAVTVRNVEVVPAKREVFFTPKDNV